MAKAQIERNRRVLDFLREHPGVTARIVAIQVMGGDGRVRTTARVYAQTSLSFLHRQGLARKELADPLDPKGSNRWYAEVVDTKSEDA